MTTFTATFSAVSISATQDAFEIVTPADTRVAINQVAIGQYSDFGDAAAEMIGVTIIRGFTTTGSAGSTVTPANLEPWSRASVCSVYTNNTGLAANGSAQTLVADSFNIQSGWFYNPPDGAGDGPDERIWLSPSTRLVVRLTAPADAITTNGTMIFEETGRGLLA